MKQQLKSEHIAWYLPHGLKVMLNQEGIFNLDSEYGTPYQAKLPLTVTGFTYMDGEIEINAESGKNWGVGYAPISEFDILLRPMYDLTKTFIKDGEETTHLQELAKMALQKVFRMLEKEDLTLENITIQDTDFGKMIRFEHHGSWFKFICESDYKSQRYGFYFIRDNDINYYLNQITLFQYLAKEKFDFQNLIADGLAIDANTLQTNPYL